MTLELVAVRNRKGRNWKGWNRRGWAAVLTVNDLHDLPTDRVNPRRPPRRW
jgi:hypothetical protein